MRRIFVGDVQGCADEFEELVGRAANRFGEAFELWIVGDLVNRGPQNLPLLRRVRELVEAGRCRFILGNHEIGLLRVAWGLRELRPLDTFGDILAAPDCADWMEWLRRCPLAEAGVLGEQHFVMVHAAVHPDWSVEETVAAARAVERELGAEESERAGRLLAPDASPTPESDRLDLLTRCRSVTADGACSSIEPARPEDAWHVHWARARHDYGVVYGHWSLQGLHVAEGLRGLDTGCVHHGRGRTGYLTAWLPEPDDPRPFRVPDERFWQVPARRAYYLELASQSSRSSP